MFGLTRQQRQAIYVVFLLLLLGWAVKAWRTAHPPPVAGSDQTLSSNTIVGSNASLPSTGRDSEK